MNERIWDKFLTERDKAVFAAGGFGAREPASAIDRRSSLSTSIGRSAASGRNPFWSQSSAGVPRVERRAGWLLNTLGN